LRLADLIVRTAEAGLRLQQPDGSFPPGCNGPYGDAETPLRNTAHWTITLLAAHRISGGKSFRDGAARARAVLLAPAARPMGAAFLCRTNPEKDFANGLIGQAWVIEALAELHATLADQRCHDLATEVFRLHPFSEDRGLWQRVNVDGSLHTVDPTFNHQLFFAAAGALLDPSGAGEIWQLVRRFMDRAKEGTLGVRLTGRIRHAAGPRRIRSRVRGLLAGLLHPTARLQDGRRLSVKEIGYHAFNLYGLARLHRSVPDHPLWRAPRFVRAVRYLRSAAFQSAIDNPFGVPYNPVGLEAAFAIETFQALSPLELGSPAAWVERQLSHTLEPASCLMTRNTPDPQTLAARFYEVTRLSTLDLEIDLG
jgi:hypothetical protein